MKTLLAFLVAAGAASAAPTLTPERDWPQPAQPTAIVVHGINPIHADLDPLVAELEARRFVVLRYVYDDRARLKRSQAALSQALGELVQRRRPGPLLVVAHSMGGLVARRALVTPLPGDRPATLITLATPFRGFHSANWAYLGFGLTPKVYKDLASLSRYIRRPGKLPHLVAHVKVVTDEKGRTLAGEDDCVLSLSKQSRGRVDAQVRHTYVLPLGHVGVLRDATRAVPVEVRQILDRHRPRVATGGLTALSTP